MKYNQEEIEEMNEHFDYDMPDIDFFVEQYELEEAIWEEIWQDYMSDYWIEYFKNEKFI